MANPDYVTGNKIGRGRPKGSENRVTIEFKEALNALLVHAAPQMVGWLDRIAQESPEKALDTVGKLAEYIHPKLARSEQKIDMAATVEHKISATDQDIINRYLDKSK